MADAGITDLLTQLSAGDRSAADRLLPLVYGELRRLARRQLRGERPGGTLDTTALVHEAYLRLGLARVAWSDRAHFFAVAARAMRRVLVDHARSRRAGKRGDGLGLLPLDETVAAPERRLDDLLAIDEALAQLERIDARQVRVVECHVFAGMSLEETAAALEVSPATVSRDWALARAWLNRQLTAPPGSEPAGGARGDDAAGRPAPAGSAPGREMRSGWAPARDSRVGDAWARGSRSPDSAHRNARDGSEESARDVPGGETPAGETPGSRAPAGGVPGRAGGCAGGRTEPS